MERDQRSGERQAGGERSAFPAARLCLSACTAQRIRLASAGVLVGWGVVRSDRSSKKESRREKGGCDHKWENKVRRGVGGSGREIDPSDPSGRLIRISLNCDCNRAPKRPTAVNWAQRPVTGQLTVAVCVAVTLNLT